MLSGRTLYPDRVHVYAIGLRTRFRRITVREGVLIEGPAGWGEFSPFWDYDATESAACATARALPEPQTTGAAR